MPMSLPSYLRAQSDGVYLGVKLQPRASANQVLGPLGAELRIKVTAPPVDAAANEALLRLLVDRLGCARGQVALVRGHQVTHKVVRVQGMDAVTVAAKLER
jgi:hypothetical protein